LRGKADVIVAVDVSGGATAAQTVPDPWETVFAAITLMSHTIVTEKLKSGAPDLLVRPNIGVFRVLDFFQASAILRAAEPAKAELKERLGRLLA
jgi:NTE family protein